MRTFGTHGPVNPKENYIVTHSQETDYSPHAIFRKCETHQPHQTLNRA